MAFVMEDYEFSGSRIRDQATMDTMENVFYVAF